MDADIDDLENNFALLINPNGNIKKGETRITTGVYVPYGYDENTTTAMTNILYILAAVFHRINTDIKFAKKMIEYTKEYLEEEDRKEEATVKKAKKRRKDSATVIKLRPDTPTEGNA